MLTDVARGLQVPAGIWERPDNAPDGWEVPRDEVDEVLEVIFERFAVWRMYADPYRWGPWLSHWAGTYGEDRVVSFDTTKARRMAQAILDYQTAMTDGDLTHNGDARLAAHIGNAVKRKTHLTLIDPTTNDEQPLYVMAKPGGKDSTRWIDAAMAACLSWRARMDAIETGAKPPKKYQSVGL